MQAVAVFKSNCTDLGSGCGLKLGRQAAWRPGTIGMVSSSWLAALCRLAAGCNRGGVVWLVALFGSCCFVIACCGLWFWARARSSSCLAAEVHSNWCRLVSGIVFAVVVTGNCWDLGSGRGLNLVVWLFGDWCTIGLVDKSSISQWAVRSSKFLEIVLGKLFLVGQSSRNL